MNRRQKAVARESYYQPSFMAALLALAVAFLLAWHGMAKAGTLDTAPKLQTSHVPATTRQSGDAAAPSAACTDTMDMAPEDAASSPFDADLVAFHGKAKALKIADGICRDQSQRVSSS